MSLLSVTPDMFVENEIRYLDLLNDRNNWDMIPLLNANDVENLHNKRLVRFQGMIQDMFDPEFYHEKFEVVDEISKERSLRNGKYVDLTEFKKNEIIDEDSVNNVISERQTFVVMSVPCLNDWVSNILDVKYKINPTTSQESVDQSKKRNLEIEEVIETESSASFSSNDFKKQRVEQTTSNCFDLSESQNLLNVPFPEYSGKICHIKMYCNTKSLKLNQVIEIVGFLSVNPLLADISNNDYESNLEVQTRNPPPSLIPRIHCIMFKQMVHNNPLVDEIKMDPEKFKFIKRELHIVLTQILMGDTLAAEYLLYHLVSKVYQGNIYEVLGKFALNISCIPVTQVADYCKHLYEFISMLVTKSHYVPMTLEHLNKTTFVPKKDYDRNRVTSGLLQLSANTHMVLDETKLTNGTLNESAVGGLNAIKEIINTQKASYNFNYYPLNFECDIPFLILSEGKSLFPSDFHVRLKLDERCIDTFTEIFQAAKHFLKPELLNDIRTYLTLVRHADYEVSANMRATLQGELMDLLEAKTATVDDLHSCLVVTRLICLSEGKSNMDIACWRKACDLEAERKSRLA